jgi:hypothetical protein
MSKTLPDPPRKTFGRKGLSFFLLTITAKNSTIEIVTKSDRKAFDRDT